MSRRKKRFPRILIVGDEEMLLERVLAVLINERYRCIPAASPKEAISICKRDDALDLVVSEFNMPTMSGLRLRNAIRELRPDLEVLFISGNPDTCDMLANQGFPHLQNPFSYTELACTIRETLVRTR